MIRLAARVVLVTLVAAASAPDASTERCGWESFSLNALEKRRDEGAQRQRELLARSDAPAMKVRKKVQAMLDAEG
jgi:hypothetical protein